MCSERFYHHFNKITQFLSLLVPRMLQKDCFSHFANYLQNQLRWAVGNVNFFKVSMLIEAMVAGVIRITKIQKFLFQAYFSRFKIQFSDIRGSQNKAPNKLGYNFTWIWVTIFVFYVWSFYLIKLAIGTAKKPVFIKKKWKLQKMLYFTLSQPPFKGYNPGWLSSWDNFITFDSRYLANH